MGDYGFLNDISTSLDDYPRSELSYFERRRALRTVRAQNGRKSAWLRNASLVTAVCACALVIVPLTPAGAAVQNLLSGIRYSLGDAFGGRDYATYAQTVHSSVQDANARVQLEDVAFYEDRIDATFLTQGEVGTTLVPDDVCIILNGAVLRPDGTSGGSGERDGIGYTEISFEVPNLAGHLEDPSTVTVEIRSLTNLATTDEDERTVKGKWSFAFEANAAELMRDTRQVAIDKRFALDDRTVVLDELLQRPTGDMEINGHEEPVSAKGSTWLYELRGSDDLGRAMVFELRKSEDGRFNLRESIRTEAAKGQASSLELQLYAMPLPRESGNEHPEDLAPVGDPITIELTE